MNFPRAADEVPTSTELFDVRLCQKHDPVLEEGVSRECIPSWEGIGPAEIVMWRTSWLTVKGVLVDPDLEDVPIKAEAPFFWLCHRRLKAAHQTAHELGRKTAWEVYHGG